MIDGDGGRDFDPIGEIQVTMGKLMGAKKQTWTGDLLHEGQGNRGQIIVRTCAVQQSNEVAKWRLKWDGIRNVEGGCAGMCGSPCFYRCEIHKEVPGNNGNFVTAVKVPGVFNSPMVNMPEQIIPLGQLCNADKSNRIKFAIVSNVTGKILHEAVTSVSELESGRT